MKPKAFIHSWRKVVGPRLLGYISQHPRQDSFSILYPQVTSRVLWMDDKHAETLNTMYVLGDPLPADEIEHIRQSDKTPA